MTRLSELARRIGGHIAGGGDPDICGVQLDSRRVVERELFAALPGRRSHGERFAEGAVARGACALLAQDLPYGWNAPKGNDRQPGAAAGAAAGSGVPVWIHADARRAAGLAAALVYGEPAKGLGVVAITGTNGKTSVAHLLGEVLERAGRTPAVLGTVGYRLAGGVFERASHTTPDAPSLQRLLATHRRGGGDALILEASSHALDQDRLAGLVPDVAVFTNLTRDHLDYHVDMERYAAAKQKLFQSLQAGGKAVIFADDPAAQRMAKVAREAGAEVLFYGSSPQSDLRMVSRHSSGGAQRLELRGLVEGSLELNLVGAHNACNALGALASAVALGVEPALVMEALTHSTAAPGRLEEIASGANAPRVFVDYAHTEDALARVLSALRTDFELRSPGRLFCVFGCGGNRDRGKRAGMGLAASAGADLCVVTSDNPRDENPLSIIGEVVAGMDAARSEWVVEPDREAAIERAIGMADAGDVVLVAGKGHETVQEIGGRRTPFDDRAVVRRILKC